MTTKHAPQIDHHNDQQAAAWNGAEGRHWAAQVDDLGGLERLVAARAVIGPGLRVLDVGCGTGGLTRLTASQVGPGSVTGIDLSAPMLAEARARTTAPNVEYVEGDAQVRRFRHRFDRIISHFGVMFFADPVAAFANLRRVGTDDATLTAVVPGPMEECSWYTVPMSALLGRAADPRTAPSAMFSLARTDHLRDVLTRAGWEWVEVEPVLAPLRFGADLETAVDFYVGSGPVRALVERTPGLDDAVARGRLASALAPWASNRGVHLEGLHWLVRAG